VATENTPSHPSPEAESRLRASEERFAGLIDSAPNGIVLVEVNGTIAYANSRAHELFGYDPEELVGQPIESLVPESLGQLHTGHRAGYLAEPRTRPMGVGLELRGRRKDGTEFPIDIGLSSFVSGGRRQVAAIVNDITDRRVAEIALAESERRFRTVLEASPNAIVAIGPDGMITYTNPQVEQTFGYARGDLIGKPIEMLLPEKVHDRHVGHRTAYFDHPTARPMGIGLDLAGRRSDGTEFPVEISLSPVDTGDGRLVFATVVDITARKTAESALAESELRFRTVLEASPNAIVAIDAAGLIAFANPAVQRTFGRPAAEIIGQPIEILLPNAVRERHVGHRTRFLGNPAARPMGIGLDLAGQRADGSEFPVEISLSPVDGPAGLLVFATVVDISGRKALEGQLVQAQKMESIGRLAGGVAHDFNNMLTAIGGYSSLLLTEFDALDPRRSRVEAITQASNKAAALTQQLLAFSRRQVLRPQLMSLNEAVTSIEPMLRPLLGERIRFHLALQDDAGMVTVDPSQLDQIIMNLAVNARDAMREGGTLKIETGRAVFTEPYTIEHFDVLPGVYAMLAVSDTGSGMDRETRQHIFEPFFTTKEGIGTGLGLATTYGIVRQSGGHIWLYSEPGKGTTFKLYFPAADQTMPEETHDGTVAPVSKGRILLVEDEEIVRSFTTYVLERSGFEVLSAQEPAVALEILARGERIDGLVSDVVMPGMSGPELAERLLDERPGLAVVFVSGYTEEAEHLASERRPTVRFLAKPYDPETLVREVHIALEAASAMSGPVGAQDNPPVAGGQ
jgi:PAS domain S-box-containing protein